MPKLIMCQGIPGSGKSTYAASLVKEGWVEVNKDQIRADLAETCQVCGAKKGDKLHTLNYADHPFTGWVWSHEKEKDVIANRNGRIEFCLSEGKNVVSSDTNFGRKHKVALEGIARKCGAEFEIKRFDVPIGWCLERNSWREKPIPEQAIKDMYYKYIVGDPIKWPNSAPALPEPVKVTRDYSLPMAVICDLDGTIAMNNGHRSFYDCTDCEQDELNETIAGIISTYDSQDLAEILYVTGREEIYREQTQKWLDAHAMPKGPLFMRKKNDTRKDAITKMELFDENIRGKWDVEFVLDDRDQVVKMWRSLGLTCLQVAEGSF